MANLIWCTDVHLDLLGTAPPWGTDLTRKRFKSPVDFGRHLRDKYPSSDGVILSGDLAEAPSVGKMLRGFSKGYKGKVYYVLGNHDFYHGSFDSVFRICRSLGKGDPNLVWLRESGVVELAPDLAICGNEGWYDGRAGHDPIRPRVIMTDFHAIQNLRGLGDFDRKVFIANTAKLWAAEAEKSLREACRKYKNVVFVTHVPPFPEATWHEGELSNGDWLPWMCNVTMGDKLIEVAYDHPHTNILVVCGHTHSPGDVKVAINLRVLTGKSEYWFPQVAQVLQLPEGMT